MKISQTIGASLKTISFLVVLFILNSCTSDDGVQDGYGTIRINITTSGIEQDIDGYEVILDGGPGEPVSNNGTVQFDSITAGAHNLVIEGTRLNCDPLEGRNQTVIVSPGRITNVSMEVSCTTKPLVFTSDRSQEFEIYRMNLNGSGVVQLTESGGWGPRWSPDALKISFRGNNGGLYIMNEDGSDKTLVLTGADYGTWSPDGLRLVTIKDGEIHTVNADGSGPAQITNLGGAASDPDWRPSIDSRIVFGYSKAGEDPGIFVINDDGSDLTRLTSGEDTQPSWSKDGSRIAFTRNTRFGPAIFIMAFPGGSPEQRTGAGVQEMDPRWSPNGAELTFTTLLTGPGQVNQEVCIGLTAEAGAINLTQNVDSDLIPDWRPEL